MVRKLQIVAAFLCNSTAGIAGDAPTFESVTKPFLAKHCTSCHGEEKQKGKLALHDLDPANLGGEDVELWWKVVEALKFGEMPPEDEPQPTDAEIAGATGWIQRELLAAGQPSDIDHKLRQPAYANLLNHEKLFDGSIQTPAFSPPRLWRLHPEAYDSFLLGFGREVSMGGPLSKPFTSPDGKGLVSNYSVLMQADSATLGQLLLNCNQIAQLQTLGFIKEQKDRKTGEVTKRLIRKAPESFLAIIDGEGAPTEDQLSAAVSEEFELVLNRTPTDDESSHFVGLLKRSIEIGGKERGLRTMAMAVLLRPEAIYRIEVGLGESDEHGRRMLSPYELAHAIAFALTDLPPDQILLGTPKPGDRSKRPQPPSLMEIAEDGKLETRKDAHSAILRIWENESIRKPRILRFFQEFFGYHTAPAVFKGDRAGNTFATPHFVKQADQLVMHLVDNDRDVLKELLTTEYYFFEWPGSPEDYEKRIQYITNRIKPENEKDRNYKYFIERTGKGLRPMPQANPAWRTTVRYYNLHEDTWDYPIEQPFAMPDGQRSGILTHPAWLVAWSGNFGNDPIRRGKWIREHLLAGSIPEIPITVDASVPEDPHKSLRDRMQVTREEYCWKCHQKMDPLGLPFEAYNDFGQFRTEEGLGTTKALSDPKDTTPAVTTGEIINSGDPSLDGKVDDVRELTRRLAASERVRQSFVRHAFRYWMGRNEMLTDSSALIAAEEAYKKNGGSFKALTLSLLTSDPFLYRK